MLLLGCSCKPVINTEFDPYVNGIDEQGIAFITNADGHLVLVHEICSNEERASGCKDWQKDYISLSIENFAEIEAEIRALNRGRNSKVKAFLDTIYFKVYKAQVNRNMYQN